MPPKSTWYRGFPQHVLFWAATAVFFLLDDRADTSLRAPFGMAAGLALVASLAAVAASSQGPRQKLRRRAYFTVSTLLLGLLSLHGAYLRTVGELRPQAIEAVLQTDWREAVSYVSGNLFVLWFLFWSLALVGLWLTFPAARPQWLGRRLVTPLLAVASLGLLWVGRTIVTEPAETVMSYRDTVRELRESTAWWRTHPLPAASSDFDGTVIVVLGESMTRHHMGLYGYPRNTTPALDARRPEMAVFRDVISNHSSTIESVSDAFTFPATVGSSATGRHPLTILQLARAAGFRTTWLSNQNEFGVWDSPVRIIAQQADAVRYHDQTSGKVQSRRVFDAAMLPSLDGVLAQPGKRKLIVMHMMSTHLPYCATKPADFNPLPKEPFSKRFFGKRETTWRKLQRAIHRRGSHLYCYDNGVRYVDTVLGAIIARAARLNEPAAVLFLSDHGEAPLLGTNHDSADHSAYQIEIPFLLWGNAAFRSQRSSTWNVALAHQGTAFSLSLMPGTLADLLAIRSPLINPEDSLLDARFRPRPRQAIDGLIHYDDQWKDNDYRENSRVLVQRLGRARGVVWAHRVNTIGHLLEAKRTFSGVEFDVRFDEKTRRFRVQHEYPDIGVRLTDMLEASRDRPDLKMWLDWKNATPANVKAAIAELSRLDAAYKIKSRVLIETDYDAVSPALSLISRAGFKHGYYLPIERIEAATSEGGPALDRVAAEVRQVVLQGRFDAITYDATLHPFVLSRLERFLDEHRVERFSWDLSVNAGDPATDPAALQRRVRDWKLSALLVRFPSDFRI